MSLPSEIDTNGDWNDVLIRLYAAFCSIFKCTPPPTICGKPVVFDRRCIDSPYEEGFWHVISRGKRDSRIPDFARARRMSWIPVMLDQSAPGLSAWKYVEGSEATRIYLWLEAEGFLVVLEEKATVASLVTAFAVDQPWMEKDLKRKRAAGTPL